MEWGGGVGLGKCVSKENPKSDLDLDLGFVNMIPIGFCHLWLSLIM